MNADKDISWYYRILEIRKQPALATHEDILKLTDDVLLNLYMGSNSNPVSSLSTMLINKTINTK